ncbi:MAG: hypothetical protein U0Q18_12055 [Bryobacteraceae bacterium]
MTNTLNILWWDDQEQYLIDYTLLMVFVALVSAVLFISSGVSFGAGWEESAAALQN